MNSFSKNLLSLAQNDQQILVATNQRKELVEKRQKSFEELKGLRDRLARLESKEGDESSRRAVDEERIKDEEKKILDRRKQLTSLGGVKAAKLMEREIDLAARAMTQLEEKALVSIQEVDKLHGEVEGLRTQLHDKEQAFEQESADFDSSISQLEERIQALQETRDSVASHVVDSHMRVYNKVRGRYPADPVVQVISGSCRGCFRALPNQIVNLIVASSSFQQCPGCSRILVSIPAGE